MLALLKANMELEGAPSRCSGIRVYGPNKRELWEQKPRPPKLANLRGLVSLETMYTS